MKNTNLTELEKRVLRDALAEGFAFDDIEDTFLTWGPIYGKQERGAVASLIKKGIIEACEDYGDIWFVCGEGVTITDIIKMSEYKR